MPSVTPEELRTLLENSAKACGYQFVQLHPARQDPFAMLGATWAGYWAEVHKPNASLGACRWQPHLPGLDSQVLAAELGIDTHWNSLDDTVCCFGDYVPSMKEFIKDHPSKAHAQAIAVLRVAAQIGDALP